MLASLAPLEVVPSLDNTDGMAGPFLGHVTHSGQGVILRVVLQYACTRVQSLSSCNYNNNSLSCHCQLEVILDKS